MIHLSTTANNVFHQYADIGCESKSSSESSGGSTLNCDHSDSSDSEIEDRSRNSPRPRRKTSHHSKLPNQMNERAMATTDADVNDELAYVDTLPEEVKLVEVTSNLWGTKFKIHGLAKTVPANLGQVTYKTSFLHLQPRQMTLIITELRDDIPLHMKSSMPRFTFSFHSNQKYKLKNLCYSQTKKLTQMRISIRMCSPKMKTTNQR